MGGCVLRLRTVREVALGAVSVRKVLDRRGVASRRWYCESKDSHKACGNGVEELHGKDVMR